MVMKPEVQKLTWWYDDAMYHGMKSELWFMCLRVFVDGTAEVIGWDWREQFPSEEEAKHWLNEEEYDPIEELRERYGLTIKLPMRFPHD